MHAFVPKYANRRDLWLALALFAAGFMLVFRGWLFSGFDGVFGDKEDGYIALALIEHWRHVFMGAANWTDPIFFYPQRGTLGYTDAFFLFGLLHAPLRMIGADTFTAYMLVMAALSAIGFFTFRRLAIRHFGLPAAYAAVGAFLFAFGNLDAVKLIHAQSYCAMLLPGLCDLALSGWNSKHRGVLLGAAVGLFYGALFLTSFQTAWFFGCYLLLLLVPLHLAIRGLPATQLLAWKIMTSKRRMMLAAVCGFAIGVMPFLFLYLPVFFAGHSRDFTEVASNLPDWRDMANVTPENAVWGPLMKWLTIAGRPDRPVWELELAFTPVVLAVFIVGMVALSKRARHPLVSSDSYLLMLGAAVVIFWLLQMDYFGVRPWRAVWALIPGGNAIRYPFRSQLVANLFVVLVAARGIAAMEGQRSIMALLCSFLIVEQINLVWPPIVSRHAALKWIASVPLPPVGCRIFYLAPGPATDDSIAPERQAAAMLFAEIRNIPTVNGYSSWFPDGWTLDEPADPRYPAAVGEWAQRNLIEQDLCALALPSGQWTARPRQP
jgi:hypothetical protein